MTNLRRYRPIGGVTAAKLFPVSELDSVEDVAKGGGIEVELLDDGSCYEETISAEQGLVSVRHTLTLCAQVDKAGEWMDADFLQRCATEGVVACVGLASGEELRLGWSPKFGFEQALRLDKLNFHSGDEPNTPPSLRLTLWSQDIESAVV